MAAKAKQADAEYSTGDFEVEFTYPLLAGTIGMEYHEEGEAPSRIIDIKDDLLIDIKWGTYGSLVPYLCGYWCVQVFLECYGNCGVDFVKTAPLIPLNPCGDGTYSATVTVPAGTIPVPSGSCSCVCKFVCTVTYLTTCTDSNGNYKPGAIAGMVEGPILQFYNMGEEVVPSP